ncbi:hypothetical protein RCC89_18245 [Cytophagaceae bacterium ABcell3]|nr:hypothetical protein RCC89_18245 [Cytophagaceae bacterium ABcell3]
MAFIKKYVFLAITAYFMCGCGLISYYITFSSYKTWYFTSDFDKKADPADCDALADSSHISGLRPFELG